VKIPESCLVLEVLTDLFHQDWVIAHHTISVFGRTSVVIVFYENIVILQIVQLPQRIYIDCTLSGFASGRPQ
jgi:hypothetical protein